jgi:hypothetical protein
MRDSIVIQELFAKIEAERIELNMSLYVPNTIAQIKRKHCQEPNCPYFNKDRARSCDCFREIAQ